MTNKPPRSRELQKAVQELLERMATPTEESEALRAKQLRLLEALRTKRDSGETAETPRGPGVDDAHRELSRRLFRGLASVKNLPMAPDEPTDTEERSDVNEGPTDE